jgi:SNF2-related domain/HMG-box domain/DNA-binding domain
VPKKNAKEDRSDWVAVAPEFSTNNQLGSSSTTIRKPSSAYQFFQRDVSAQIKDEITAGGTIPFDIANHGRAVRERWNDLNETDKEHYNEAARNDQARYAQESHVADIAAIQRREQLQRSHNQLVIYDNEDDDNDGDDDYDGVVGVTKERTTRNKWNKKQRKKQRMEKKRNKKKKDDNNNDEEAEFQHYEDGDDESDTGSWGSDDTSDEDDDDDDDDNEDGINGNNKKKRKKKVKKASPSPTRKVSQKQIERRDQVRKEKLEKEEYISSRHDNLRIERADQARRRLEFLLKQSNIFSHFGQVKEDKAKYGTNNTAIQNKLKVEDVGDNNNMSTTDSGSGRRGHSYDDDNDDDKAKALEEADEHEATFLTQQPSTIGFGQMRDYQLEGLNWMIRLQENGVNGILADEMGLGKTLQSISILVYMLEYRNDTGPHLIIVPKSTLSNWMNELARWAPTLKTVKFHGSKEEREDFVKNTLEPAHRDENRTWNVLVTTYEIINIEKNSLLKFAWSYLIVDEAHRLKNEASLFSKTVRLFETMYRILLTGTPLQNSLHELWALLNYLVPDVFANSEQFDEWFNLDIEDENEKNKLISQLHKILRPFMLRRLKVDVEKSLPPKHETILFTGMSGMQKKLYRDILIRDIDAIQGGGKNSGGSRTAILNIVMQLRKCAGHPYLFPGVEDRSLPPLGEHIIENCGKMVVLDKLLRRLHEKGHRVLLFTQMTKVTQRHYYFSYECCENRRKRSSEQLLSNSTYRIDTI